MDKLEERAKNVIKENDDIWKVELIEKALQNNKEALEAFYSLINWAVDEAYSEGYSDGY